MSVKTGVASAAAAYILTKLKGGISVDEKDVPKVLAAAFILGWSGQEFLKLLKD